MGLLDVLGAIANPIGAVVSGIAGLGQSVINANSQEATNDMNYKIHQEDNAFNAEQSQLQRNWSANQAVQNRTWQTNERTASEKWQEKMIKQQNKYNSPANQLKMLMDAGVSPATFNGNATSASPTGSPTAPSGSMPSASAASAASPIPMQAPKYEFDPLSFAQARLLDAQAKSINDSNKRENELQGVHVEQEGVRLALMSDELDNMRPAQRRLMEEQGKALAKQVALWNSEILKNEKNAALLDSQGQLVQKQVDSYAEEFAKRMAESDSRIHLNYSNAKAAVARAAESFAAAELYSKQGAVADAQAEFLKTQNQGQIIQNGLDGLEFTYQSKVNGKEAEYRLAILDDELQLVPLNGEAKRQMLETTKARSSYEENMTHYKQWTPYFLIETMSSSLGYPFGAGVNYNAGSTDSRIQNVTPSNHHTVRGFK